MATFPFLEDGWPSVSPDGSKVVYGTYRYSNGIRKEHRFEIATANIDGSDHRRLTSDKYDYDDPTWSPDGSQIAFVLNRACRRGDEGRDGLYVVDSDGSSDPRHFGPPKDPELPYQCSWYVRSPIWSPDGEYIEFYETVGYDDGWHTYIAAISPDGSGYRRIHELSFRRASFITPVSFSPDGTRLAFALYKWHDASVIRTINFDGSDPRDALTIPTTYEMRGGSPPPPNVGPRPVRYIGHVAWSPDGSEIIFASVSARSDDPRSLVSGIHAISMDGTGLRTLVEFDVYGDNVRETAWPVALSPDGSRFAVLRTPPDLVPRLTGGIKHPDDAWYSQYERRRGYYIVESDGSRHEVREEGIILLTVAADGSDSRVLVREVHEAFVPGNPSRNAGADGPGGCSTGIAIQEPEKNPELVRDCEILLEIRDVLAGPEGFLNWNPNRSMEVWHGISIGGSPFRPLRVESIKLGYDYGTDVEINGVLPPQLGELDGLKELAIDQPLTGPIPRSLGNLAKLESLTIASGRPDSLIPSLSGTIPPELGNMTKLTSLILAGDFTGSIPAELGKLERLERLIVLRSSVTGCIPIALASKSNIYIQIKGLQSC